MTDSEKLNTLLSRQEMMNGTLTRIATLMEGDGSDDFPGMVKDVDRLKQKDRARAKWTGAAMLSAVSSLVTTLWSHITSSPPSGSH